MPEHRHEIKNELDEKEQPNGSIDLKSRAKFLKDASTAHSMVQYLCYDDVSNEQCDNRGASVKTDEPSRNEILSTAKLPRKI
jgi:hypothetical protein